MKANALRVLKTAGFLAVFLVVFYFVAATLKFKHMDGIRPMENYYALPEDTVDVLLLGSSHMGMNVNPALMWESEGIAAYACWGSVQPTWNTYHYLRECLKTQRPKLIVMDAYTAALDIEYSDYETMVKNLLGMRFSANKLEAIRVFSPPEYRADVLLGLPTYHYRYADLTAEDFQYYFWQKDPSLQRLTTSDAVYPIRILDAAQVTDSAELPEKMADYLDRIIACCREEGIPLLLVAAPYELSALEQQRFNRVKALAAEQGLSFLNFNEFYADAGIDPETDFCDPGHLNNGGIAKYTAYLTNYLVSHYDLPDRRQDSAHIWNRAAEAASQEDHCVYRLTEQFQGDGLTYLDTGLSLYGNPYAPYTILAQLDTACEGEDMVFLSCFSEEEGRYRGVLVRKENDGAIYVVFHSGAYVTLKDFGDVLNLAVVKNDLTYQVYADGQLAGSLTLNALDPYDGPLLLGCELDAQGRPFRHSEVRVRNLEVYDAALDTSLIAMWQPEQLPEPPAPEAPSAGSEPDYELAHRFHSGALDSHVDTGVSLYDEAGKSWTVLAQFQEGDDFGSGVYFSCFAEEEGNYRGLLVRRAGPGRLEIMCGRQGTAADVGIGADVNLAVVKDVYRYTVYVNGEKLLDGVKLPAEAYPGHLLIAAQETMDGEVFRRSAVTIYNLEYYSGVMAEEDILSWRPEYKAPAEQAAGSPVAYTLEQPFTGDGQSAYIDTETQLYDVPEKSWTLTMTFLSDEAATGTLASCYAEEPDHYRGLLIRLTSASTLSLTLGAHAETIALPPQTRQTLQIVKEGFTYTVLLNGAVVADRVESGAPAYDGTLRIGCQVRENGTPFRFSRAAIEEFRVTGSDQ